MNTHIPYQPLRSLAAIPERTFIAWRSPERFTKNPDVVALPSGKLLTVYADTDQHWAKGIIRLTLIESIDRGRTWSNPRVLITSDRTQHEPHWVTPRISRLNDGRLVVLCDRDDFEHCHEDQEAGIFIWWSDDEGENWSEPINTGIPGIEPDRVIELPDGRLLIGAHIAFADTQKLGQFVCISHDQGQTWSQPVIIAKDTVHNYCEGAFVPLQNNTLVCIMRDNSHNGYPCQLAFSFDQGEHWTEPVEAPFSGDRPFAKQLADGRVLVTYRNQGGNRGTYAWLGDIEQEVGYRCSALHLGAEKLHLDRNEGLCITHNKSATTQYYLLPPESFRSEVLLEAQVRVAGRPEDECAYIQIAHIGLRLAIRAREIYLDDANPMVDRSWAADMTQWRRLRIHHRRGLLRIYLDGQEVLRNHVLGDSGLSPTYFGTTRNTNGTAWWRSVIYYTQNQTEPEHRWIWNAHSGHFPDHYELDRILELHANTHARPDNGYSSWHQFEDGEILVLDYTNSGDPYGQAHIVGCLLYPQDFDTMGRRSSE